MRLPVLSLLLLSVCSCNSPKEITIGHTITSQPSDVIIAIVIEGSNDHCSLNDVFSSCNQVKPFKTFNVNYYSPEKMEVRLVYDHITAGQREEIYSQLNGMAGVRVIR